MLQMLRESTAASSEWAFPGRRSTGAESECRQCQRTGRRRGRRHRNHASAFRGGVALLSQQSLRINRRDRQRSFSLRTTRIECSLEYFTRGNPIRRDAQLFAIDSNPRSFFLHVLEWQTIRQYGISVSGNTPEGPKRLSKCAKGQKLRKVSLLPPNLCTTDRSHWFNIH